MGTQDERQKAFCRWCMGMCGILVTVKEGRVVKVAPDPESPTTRGTLCPKGRAIPEVLYHPDRLLYPQKREGERGGGVWLRVSWDEALTAIAQRLNGLKRDFGPESVVIGLGQPKGLELAFAQRFASAFGTPNIATPGAVCHMPDQLASAFTIGSPSFVDSGHLPRCLVVWGSNILQTCSGSLNRAQLRSALRKGLKLIVIDPQKTEMASWSHLWLRPRPGSDGALALGMIRVTVEEGLYDEEFVANWTTGFDRLREHVKGYPLEEVERITWVPREQIEEAARLYAGTKPAAIQLGNAPEHSVNGFQACRAIHILKAITGNIDIPGGDVTPSFITTMRPGQFMLLRDLPRNLDKMLGAEYKLAARANFIPRESAIKAILDEKPYPVKGALMFGTNPLLTYANARETYEALMKLELLVVADLFMTPTAELADIVLPVATNLEFEEIAPYPGPFMFAYPKVVEPPGECWPDIKIINELAKRVGLDEYFWADEKEAFDLILSPSGLTFEELKKQRVLQAEMQYRKYEKAGFRTQSGKVEIYSQVLEGLGYSPLPVFNEPAETPYGSPELARDYPLVLTSAKEAYYYHSACRNIPRLRRIAPHPIARLNPETAAKLGLAEGDWVYIETKRGRIKQRLSLDRDLDPRVVVAAYGWWFPERGVSELHGWNESNINLLTENAPPYDPAVGSVNLRGILCRVSKA